LLSLAAAGRLGEGACVRADLRDPPSARALRAAPFLASRPVAGLPEARRLIALGVTALVVDDLGLLAALAAGDLSGAPSPPSPGRVA
jgi:hypothetical protein